jgi:hypothetical protein
MPAFLHDTAVHESIRARVQSLSPNATRRWGKMTVDQMVWHCNQVLKTALGDISVKPNRPPFPVPVLKFMLFNLPWPHGAPTAPEYKAVDRQAFEEERQRCLELIDRFISRGLAESWSPSVFGPLTGREWSRLHAKHLDHHLKQFSV